MACACAEANQWRESSRHQIASRAPHPACPPGHVVLVRVCDDQVVAVAHIAQQARLKPAARQGGGQPGLLQHCQNRACRLTGRQCSWWLSETVCMPTGLRPFLPSAQPSPGGPLPQHALGLLGAASKHQLVKLQQWRQAGTRQQASQ